MAFAIPYVVAAVAAASAYSGNKAKEQAAEYNAQVADVNKGFALRDQETQFARTQGRAIASYGAGGVQLGTGSPMDVLADAAGQSELDRLKIKYNYESKSNLFRSEASNLRSSSLFETAAGGLRGYAMAIPMFGAAAPSAPAATIPIDGY